MRRFLACTAASIVWTLTIGVAAPASQPAAQEPLTQGLAGYMSLVNDHAPSERDRSVAEISTFQPATLSSIVKHLTIFAKELPGRRRIARMKESLPLVEPAPIEVGGMRYAVDDVQRLLGLTDLEADHGDLSRPIRRSIGLHTDTGLALWGDGLQDQALRQWRVCQDLMRLIPGGASGAALVRSWHLAVAGFLGDAALWDAGITLDEGLRLLPADAELETAAGALHENLATPQTQRDIKRWQELWRDAQWARGRFDVKDGAGELRIALGHLRRAVTLRPDLGEAQLRYGRVLLELGQREAARTALQRAVADVDPFVAYNALLFLGRSFHDAGEFGEARRLYEKALALAPAGQSARIALSLLVLDSGQRLAGPSSLGLDNGTEDDRDPWWDYAPGATRTAASNFAAVWKAADAARMGPPQ